MMSTDVLNISQKVQTAAARGSRSEWSLHKRGEGNDFPRQCYSCTEAQYSMSKSQFELWLVRLYQRPIIDMDGFGNECKRSPLKCRKAEVRFQRVIDPICRSLLAECWSSYFKHFICNTVLLRLQYALHRWSKYYWTKTISNRNVWVSLPFSY